MKNYYQEIRYNNKNYKVCLDSNGKIFVVDSDLELPNKNFYTMTNGYICYRAREKPEYLQNLVMNYRFDGEYYIDHINRIPQDNRKDNLRLITQSDQNKNQSKKKRNVILPENCGIDPENIPTFIWYLKAGSGHADRWAVDIKKKHFWKTTSRKDLSTKCKFEWAKKYLRELNMQKPELFIGHCQNGELNKDGKILEQEYIGILKKAGYVYITNNVENNCLKEDFTGLSDSEILFLQNEIHLKDDIPH